MKFLAQGNTTTVPALTRDRARVVIFTWSRLQYLMVVCSGICSLRVVSCIMTDIKYSEECTGKDKTAVPCIPSVSKLIDFITMRAHVQCDMLRGNEVASNNAPILIERFAPVIITLDERSTEDPVREVAYHCEESLTYGEHSQHKVNGERVSSSLISMCAPRDMSSN